MKKTSIGFRIFRSILGPIFKLYYSPKIENAEVIPTEGPIIVCGHHKHLYDQCLPIVSTKRTINYMAKKEYFDNKKVAWFFRAAGCIPVDRSKKDNDAKQAAIEVLNNGGAIGIFPEGTRNALKDEKIKELYELLKLEEKIKYKKFRKKFKYANPKTSQIELLKELYKNKKVKLDEFREYVYNPNELLLKLKKKKVITKKEYEASILLPLKFGTVSMAQKTNATIVPFGLVGDYHFRSKTLKCKFGKPFKVGDMDLEEANNKLFEEMKNLMLEED